MSNDRCGTCPYWCRHDDLPNVGHCSQKPDRLILALEKRCTPQRRDDSTTLPLFTDLRQEVPA